MTNWQKPIQYLVSPYDTIVNGRIIVTAAGTAVKLGSHILKSGVTVKALSSNTGIVYVGNKMVAAGNGFELAAGEHTFIETSDLALVYIDVATNDDGVTFIGG